MSRIVPGGLKHHPFFVNVVNSFTDQQDWLKEATLEELVSGTSPLTMVDGASFEEYFVKNLFKKAENIDLGVDPDQVAFDDMTSFLKDQEAVHHKVKLLLSKLQPGHPLYDVIVWVRQFFRRCLGDFSPNDVKPRYTYGASLTLRRGNTVIDRYKAAEGVGVLKDKFWTYSDLSTEPRSIVGPMEPKQAFTSLLGLPFDDRATNTYNYVQLEAVPKTAKISRIIGKQPTLFLALQAGVGDILVDILYKYCGIDLTTAPDIHKELAMEGSLSGLLCTLDQRKASDNILRILCEAVLPREFYDFIAYISPSDLRIGDSVYSSRMMCPAGNGLIFPLQTLLFWALIKGTQHASGKTGDVYVFGDDVIIEKQNYDNTVKVLEAFGLQINNDKSFKDGPFRESCGGDYLYGSNVRPLYVKEIPTSTISWIRVINGIRRVGYYNNAGVWRSDSFRSLWLRCIRTIPVKDRLFCPRHYGDAGINTEFTTFYTLGEPRRRDYEGIKYPSPFGFEGNPYSAETIKIYVAESGGDDRMHFAELSKGIPADSLLRLVSDPSIAGSGGRMVRRKGEPKPVFSYPKVFNATFDKYVAKFVPYTIYGSAPEDINDLFAFLAERGSKTHVTNPRLALGVYHAKLFAKRQELVTLLNNIKLSRSVVELDVQQELDEFTFV